MKRIGAILSLIIPAGLLLSLTLSPAQDSMHHLPLLHFYLVTFFPFAAAVVAFFTAVALGQQAPARHRLLATAFAVMGAVFLVHGLTTPGAITLVRNPGVTWASWLTLFLGSAIFAVASLDRPERPLPLQRLRHVHVALGAAITLFVLIVAFAPGWLAYIDERVAGWHKAAAYALTFALWLFAAVRLTLLWRQTRLDVDGVMALIAGWQLLGTVSLHSFETWHLSWWLYHILLLLGVITALVSLALAYEQVRRFRLTYYYAGFGLVATAGLALLSSHFISSGVAEVLNGSTPAGEELLVRVRLLTLLVAGAAGGLLLLAMIGIVRRAERLLSSRTDELAAAYASLQSAEALRDDLSGMIVHDLRTPLTSMRLSVDLLRALLNQEGRQQERQTVLDRLEHSTERMLSLVTQLLDVSRLEAGQLPLNYQPLDICALLHEKAALFSPQAQRENKQITVDTPPVLPTPPADRELVGRVLDNLLSNAFKYTSEGGQIILQATPNGNALEIGVADDGPGIAPEQAVHIFDKFYQIQDGSPTRRGSGLGLAFCRLVVETHGGKIWVDSRPGAGSRFTFTLPFEQVRG